MSEEFNIETFEVNRSTYDESNPENLTYKAPLGITEELVREISKTKGEPEWMLNKRLQGFKLYQQLPMPNWGPSLEKLNLDEIHFYLRPDAKNNANNWEDVPQDIKNTFTKLGIPQAEHKALAGVGAQYECLTGDSIVFTNSAGPKEIRNIKSGDKVFSFDESTNELKSAVVKGLALKGNKDVFEVVVGSRRIKATSNHPFLALVHTKKEGKIRGRYKREWKYLSDLKVGDLIAVARHIPFEGQPYELPKLGVISKKHNFIKVPRHTTDDLMWFLGLYLGDGCIHKEKNKARIEIAIPDQDNQLQEELIKTVNGTFQIKASRSDGYRVTIYSTLLADLIEKIGFEGKSKTKKIPRWVFSLPRSQILAFLGGYLDSDGYVRNTVKSHDLIFTSSNKQILESVKLLALQVGLISSNIHEFKSKHPFEKQRFITAYRSEVSGNTDIIASRSEKRYSRFGKKKYYHKFNSAKNTSFRKYVSDYVGFAKIESIVARGVQQVYDIEVEKYHNFVAEGIIVHNSEVVYHKLREDLEKKGVVFLDCDEAVKQYPELVKKYFMTSCVPINLHKFTALHAACWSGGTFIYVPKGVHVDLPLQAYFRMNAKSGGQFEHTLIIVDEGANLHYIEGCSAPQYTKSSLHAGCVEIHVLKGARARYSSIENWSRNTYNLNTKRAVVSEDGIIEWVNGNLGSGVTMLYPASLLVGNNSKSNFIGIAFANKDQNQDTGCKVIHVGKNTSSTIVSKSIAKNGGITSYRGLVSIRKGATGAKSSVECDALMIDNLSQSNTYPYIDSKEQEVDVAHEATVGKISEEQIFYLMSRGLSEEQAVGMIVSGFIEPIVKELPLEYAVELNRLIELEMEGTLG